MVLLGLSAAGVVVVLVAARAWSMRLDRRRSHVQTDVTEEEPRENAGPLTRAILSWSAPASAASRERRES